MANGELAAWGNEGRNDWAQAAEKAGNLVLGKMQTKLFHIFKSQALNPDKNLFYLALSHIC